MLNHPAIYMALVRLKLVIINITDNDINITVMYRTLCVLLFAASSLAFRLPRKNTVPFILNGEDADVGEWPHQVILFSTIPNLKCYKHLTIIHNKKPLQKS